MLCATWLAFYHYLARHPNLLKEQVKDGFFPVERFRALAGVVPGSTPISPGSRRWPAGWPTRRH
ncbi:hypothetical protein [Micromonospora rhizosphaerae]|uniref:hypothetical protein n=1 Tax=Micromonospora rhizosphaerae TaxID=568872 RepID=UPI00114CA7ED|nr:hypothetical protein [Micromonospora rhizosphaerae]